MKPSGITPLLPLTLFALPGFADPQNAPPLLPGDHHLKLSQGGIERTFTVHVPQPPKDAKRATAAKKGLPLLLMLHGAGGSGDQAAQQTGWAAKADREDFVAVFPDALPADPKRPPGFLTNPRFWSDGSGRGQAARGAVDDIGFLTAVLDTVEKRCNVDPRRVYLTGFSSGASMTFAAVASSLSKRVTAAAPVSGHFWVTGKKPERAVPLLFLIGTRDPLNPMEGGTARTPWGRPEVKPKVADTVAAWAKATGCPLEPAPLKDENGVKAVAYGPGDNGAEFVFTTIEGLGHRWPGGKERLPERLVGPGTNKLNATDAIWTFLARHYLSDRDPYPVTPDPKTPSAPTVPTPTGPGAPAAPAVPEKKP